MSVMPNFVEYPQYFSLFMIWASGYVFAYVVFGRSSVWKEIDSTMKVVIAMLLGFTIEFCVILPLFYVVNVNNVMSVGLFFPAFDATWVYNWMLTFFFSIAALHFGRRSILKIANFVFGKLFYPLFFTMALLFAGLLSGYWLFYPNYIKFSTIPFTLYMIVVFILSSAGFAFCSYLRQFITRAYEEESISGYFRDGLPINRHLSDRRVRFRRNFFVFSYNWKHKIKRFEDSGKTLIVVLLIFGIAFVAVPIDSSFGVFTPKVEYSRDIGVPYPENNLFLTILTMPRTNMPEINTNFSKLAYRSIVIESGVLDRLGSVNVPLPADLIGRNIKVADANYGIFSWSDVNAFIPYPFSKETSMQEFANGQGLQVNYSKLIGHTFNVTLAYWDQTPNEGLSVIPQPIKCVEFNATHYKWTYDFQIVNNCAYHIDLRDIQFDNLICDNENKNFTSISFNGSNLTDFDIGGNNLNLGFPQPIKSNQTANMEISFLSQNKL